MEQQPRNEESSHLAAPLAEGPAAYEKQSSVESVKRCQVAQRSTGAVRFRKLPVSIEAVRINAAHFNGADFDGSPFDASPDWLVQACITGAVSIYQSTTDYAMWQIKTLEDGPNGEAKHIAGPGDWIVRGVRGELYFCKGDIFEATYEPLPV